jgi:hypothetical protein
MRDPKRPWRLGLHSLGNLDGTVSDKRDGYASPKTGEGDRDYSCARQDLAQSHLNLPWLSHPRKSLDRRRTRAIVATIKDRSPNAILCHESLI